VTRLLLDANVSPALAEALRWRGHDAVHVNDLGLRSARDEEIARTAVDLRRAVVTHDGDYLRLAREGAARPSVIHLTQRELQRDPLVGRLAQALALGDVLREHGDRLERGAAIRVDRSGSRVEPLPPSRGGPDQPQRTGPEVPRRASPDPPHRGNPAEPRRASPDQPHRGRPATPPGLERVRARELPGPGGQGR
jgi:predicted nuclease of predicted toxin-antitoxin system